MSVAAEFADATFDQAFYMQTQYGVLYWNGTAGFRQFVYIPAPAVCADFPTGGPFGVPGVGGGCCN